MTERGTCEPRFSDYLEQVMSGLHGRLPEEVLESRFSRSMLATVIEDFDHDVEVKDCIDLIVREWRAEQLWRANDAVLAGIAGRP